MNAVTYLVNPFHPIHTMPSWWSDACSVAAALIDNNVLPTFMPKLHFGCRCFVVFTFMLPIVLPYHGLYRGLTLREAVDKYT